MKSKTRSRAVLSLSLCAQPLYTLSVVNCLLSVVFCQLSERAPRAFQVSGSKFQVLNLFGILNFEFPLTAVSGLRSVVSEDHERYQASL